MLTTPDTEDTESAKEIETPGGISSPGRKSGGVFAPRK